MKKSIIGITLIILISIVFSGNTINNDKKGSFLGIYRGRKFQTWNLYRKNKQLYMECYSSINYGGERFKITKYKKSNNKYRLSAYCLTERTVYRDTEFILNYINGNWILIRQDKHRNEKFKKTEDIPSVQRLTEIKEESNILSEIAVFEDGYHYSENDKLYYIKSEYPTLFLYEYSVSSTYILTTEKIGEIFLDNGIVYYNLNGINENYSELIKNIKNWGWHSNQTFKLNSQIVDAVYIYNNTEILKSIGLEESYLMKFRESKIIISKLGNLIIDVNNNEIIDTIPRASGGIQGSGEIWIKPKMEKKVYPDSINLNINAKYTYKESLSEDYELNIEYKKDLAFLRSSGN